MIIKSLWSKTAVLLLILVLVACAPSAETVTVETTRQRATVLPSPSVTAVAPSPTATAVPALPTDTVEPTLVPTPTPSPQPPTPTPETVRLITDAPIFAGGDLRLLGWSPNSRYLAYFEYSEEQVAQSYAPGVPGSYSGTFTIYDVETGQKCQDYGLNADYPHEGSGYGDRLTWLPSGELLILLPDGELVQTAVPCQPGENMANRFGESLRSIDGYSPNQQWLIFTGETAYWLYNLQTQVAHAIPEVMPNSFNNLIWSPDSQHISITLAGKYHESRSELGGTRVVEAATGTIVSRYDWIPNNTTDSTYGGPVWISKDEFIVTMTVDQGPFFMTVAGEVRPLLPLFDLEFERGVFVPYAQVYVDSPGGDYYILLDDFFSSERKIGPRIYSSATGAVEKFDLVSLEFYLDQDGVLWQNRNGRYPSRRVSAVGEPLVEQAICYQPWDAPIGDLYSEVALDGADVLLYRFSSCELIERIRLESYVQGVYVWPWLSPNGRYVAMAVHDNQTSYGKALFVVPIGDGE